MGGLSFRERYVGRDRFYVHHYTGWIYLPIQSVSLSIQASTHDDVAFASAAAFGTGGRTKGRMDVRVAGMEEVERNGGGWT